MASMSSSCMCTTGPVCNGPFHIIPLPAPWRLKNDNVGYIQMNKLVIDVPKKAFFKRSIRMS